MEMTVKATRRSAPLTLLLLVALFAVPPLLGWLYFFNPQWLPDKHNNNGVLIQPSRSLQAVSLRSSDGRLINIGEMNNAWRMLVVSEAGCSEGCLERLDSLQKIRRATGAGRQRIQSVLLVLSGQSDTALQQRVPPETEIIYSSADQKSAVIALFEMENSAAADNSFVIDPLGALMMRHNHSILSQKQILKDMETLLKISQNWVKGTQYGHN
ncbi:MAG: hypothetical protein V7739_00765 [Motiliproteus sp.]